MEFLNAIYKYLKVDFYDDCKSRCHVVALPYHFFLYNVLVSWEIIGGIYFVEIYISLLFYLS